MVNTFEPIAFPVTEETEADPVPENPVVAMGIDGLLLTEAEFGSTVNWNGVDYPCTAGPAFVHRIIDEGGFVNDSRVRITVRTSVFGDNPPQEKQTVLYTFIPGLPAQRFRIDSINNFYGAFLELFCTSADEGA